MKALSLALFLISGTAFCMESRFAQNQPIDSHDYPRAISFMQAIMRGQASLRKGTFNSNFLRFSDFRSEHDEIMYTLTFEAARTTLSNSYAPQKLNCIHSKLFLIDCLDDNSIQEKNQKKLILLKDLNLKELYKLQREAFQKFNYGHPEIESALSKNNAVEFSSAMAAVYMNQPTIIERVNKMIEELEKSK